MFAKQRNQRSRERSTSDRCYWTPHAHCGHEARNAFEELKAAFADLIAKHEEYTMFLEDEEYPAAESWMEECTLKYVNFSMQVNDYFHKPCEDKEKNAASVVDADETEVHGLQGAVVTENEMHKATQRIHRTPQ